MRLYEREWIMFPCALPEETTSSLMNLMIFSLKWMVLSPLTLPGLTWTWPSPGHCFFLYCIGPVQKVSPFGQECVMVTHGLYTAGNTLTCKSMWPGRKEPWSTILSFPWSLHRPSFSIIPLCWALCSDHRKRYEGLAAVSLWDAEQSAAASLIVWINDNKIRSTAQISEIGGESFIS